MSLLNARPYQLEILTKAKLSNVLAILKTGAGKTLIALELLIHSNSLKPLSKSVFLACTVPLVNQQSKYIAKHSSLRTFAIHGSQNIEYNKDFWRYVLNGNDVIVCTPAILLAALEHGFLSLSAFHLLVFDECHHCVKDHPYNLIMSRYYAPLPKAERPKIFGMTASPITKGHVLSSLKSLESNLDSVAITVSDQSSLEDYVSRPMERIVYYLPGDFFPPPSLYITVNNRCPDILPYIHREIGDVLAFSDLLGPWAADRALEFAIVAILDQIKAEEVRRAQSPSALVNSFQKMKITDRYQSPDDLNFTNLKEDKSSFKTVPAESLCQFKNFCQQITGDIQSRGRIEPPKWSEIGAKAQCLIKILLEYKDEADLFCGIIFCEQRIMAKLLEMILAMYEPLNFINVSLLLGHGTRSTSILNKSVKMTMAEQTSIIQNFRMGKLNLLVSTSVAEEGLDIKPCNCVIRFDCLEANLRSYIQSRGRARHKSSQFILIAEEGDLSAQNILSHLANSEKGVIKHLQEWHVPDDREEFIEHEFESYTVESTGATAYYQNSIRIVQIYCDIACQGESPEYFGAQGKDGFVCELLMPQSVPPECSRLRGTFMNSLKLAKSDVALRMIKLMHSFGQLDDNLRPVSENSSSFKSWADSGEVSKNKGVFQVYPIKIPDAFTGSLTIGNKMYVNVIMLKEENEMLLNIGLLSFRPLAVTQELNLNGGKATVSFRNFTEQLVLNAENLPLLKLFHFHLFQAMTRSDFTLDEKFVTLCVPMKNISNEVLENNPKDHIDWGALEFCANNDVHNLDFLGNGYAQLDQINEYVLYDEQRYKRNYFINCLKPELDPFTKDNYCSPHFSCTADEYKYRLQFSGEIIQKQFLIEGTFIGYPVTPLVKRVELEPVLIIPQFAQVCRIQRRFLEHGVYLPALLPQLFHGLLMDEVMTGKAFGGKLFNTSRKLLQMALTTENAQLPFSYERLEYLGDIVLKLVLSVHLFVRYPNALEGTLTVERSLLERNSNLYKKAVELKLCEYILQEKFSRKTFVPPHSNQFQVMRDKTIADTVEAVIGACFVHAGVESAIDAIKFFVGDQFEEKFADYGVEWGNNESKRTKRHITEIEMATCAGIEDTLGYEFKDQSLLCEALVHSSSTSHFRSYQRLEFLGDVILGFLVSNYIYYLDVEYDPDQMHFIRSEMTNNQFFGAVACKLNLVDHLQQHSDKLGLTISNWREKFNKAMSESSFDSEKWKDDHVLFYWNYLEYCPKVLGDIFESVIGAVFVDSKFSIEVMTRVFNNVLIQPWWDRFEFGLKTNGSLVLNPVQELKEHPVVNTCTQVKSHDVKVDEKTCSTISIHGVIIGKGYGLNKREARKFAAYQAISYLKTKEVLCNCLTLTEQ